MMRPSKLRPSDALRVAGAGLKARPLRAVLSALGIAVGIAAMIAVVGISASSRAEIDQQLRALGTNLLTVEPGQELRSGETAKLPAESVDMVARIGPVTSVSAVGAIDDAFVYRSDHIDELHTNGITALAARPDLLGAVGGEVASGRWLDDALAAYPTVVLGATTAERLGISQADGSVAVWLGEQWFTVVGILDPAPLAPELDAAALVGVADRGRGARLRRRADQALRTLTGVASGRYPCRVAGHRQPGEPRRGHGQPSLGRPGRAGRHGRDVDHAPARARGRRPACGRHRRGQHHGHRSARATLGDRSAPGPRRHPRTCPDPVPRRVGAAGRPRRDRWGRPRRYGDGRVRGHARLAVRATALGAGWRGGRRSWSAPSPAPTPRPEQPACRRRPPWPRCES